MTFQPIGLAATRVVDRIAEIQRKDTARGKQAAAAVRAKGGSAVEAMSAMIDATFDEAGKARSFKIRILDMIRRGTGHAAVRARYGRRAAELRGLHIDAAIFIATMKYFEVRRQHQIGTALGYGNQLSLDVLREIRMLLRLIRRSEFKNDFQGILSFVIGAEPMALQAAE